VALGALHSNRSPTVCASARGFAALPCGKPPAFRGVSPIVKREALPRQLPARQSLTLRKELAASESRRRSAREAAKPRTQEAAKPRTQEAAKPRTQEAAKPRTQEATKPRTQEATKPRTQEAAQPRTQSVKVLVLSDRLFLRLLSAIPLSAW
jgi:hypothetical protein